MQIKSKKQRAKPTVDFMAAFMFSQGTLYNYIYREIERDITISCILC